MKHIVNPQQRLLFNPFQGIIPPLGLELILQGWQGICRASLLKLMPVRELGCHFDPSLGRPTKELYSVAGLLFLQEAFNWTNEEARDAYLFHTDVQFALNLEPGRNQISLRTVERYRKLFLEDDLAAEVQYRVTATLVDELDLNLERQRLDSTHVFSDMASFGRTRMMGVTIKRFLTQVQRHHHADFVALPQELRQRYAPSQAKLFAMKGQSPEQRAKTRQQVAEDMRDLIDRFADHAGLHSRPSYRMLVTVFEQQCEVVDDKLQVKAKTGGNCVQNPSDPDATYDGNKGPGYKVQLVETCAEDNDVQLIVAVLPQTAVEHDANSLAPVLADLQAQGFLPQDMLADTSYGSDENVQLAAALGVELVSPVPGNDTTQATAESATPDAPATPDGKSPDAPEPVLEKLSIDDFAVDERTGKVTACPSGRIPLQVLYDQEKDTTTIEMHAADCASCPYREACPMKKTKKGKYRLTYTGKERRNDARRREQQTEPFKERYGGRSGIESTNSGTKRKQGMGELRVRGSPAVYHAIYLRVAGWNMSRAAASGKLVSKVAEMLRELGLLGGWPVCWRRLWQVMRFWMPWRAQPWTSQA